MDQAQTAQGPFSQGVVAQVGDDQTLFIADDDVLDDTGAIDQDADLPANFNRQLDETGGQFLAAELCRWNAPAVEPLQGLDVTGF